MSVAEERLAKLEALEKAQALEQGRPLSPSKVTFHGAVGGEAANGAANGSASQRPVAGLTVEVPQAQAVSLDFLPAQPLGFKVAPGGLPNPLLTPRGKGEVL